MNKLRLSLDELAVESFSTSQLAPPRGTVGAHSEVTYTYAGSDECYSHDDTCSCYESGCCTNWDQCRGTERCPDDGSYDCTLGCDTQPNCVTIRC